MKKVYLSLDEIDLGYLVQTDQSYLFIANEDGVNEAITTNPVAMKFFNLNKIGEKSYQQIPHLFAQFLLASSRNDLCEKAKFNETDDEFEKLFKLAGLNIMQINFKIHQ